MAEGAREVRSVEDTVVGTWFERDRAHVCLSVAAEGGEAGDTLVEWWDDAVFGALEDGTLRSSDFRGSAYAYAATHGILSSPVPVTFCPSKAGYVAAHPDKGLYLGWRPGGAPIWSSEATPEEVADGAYVFGSARHVEESLAEDAERVRASGDGDLAVASALAEAGLDGQAEAFEVDLGIPSTSNAWRAKVSVEECVEAGVALPDGPSPSA